MSQGLIFIRTNIQLFLFNEVCIKAVLGTFLLLCLQRLIFLLLFEYLIWFYNFILVLDQDY